QPPPWESDVSRGVVVSSILDFSPPTSITGGACANICYQSKEQSVEYAAPFRPTLSPGPIAPATRVPGSHYLPPPDQNRIPAPHPVADNACDCCGYTPGRNAAQPAAEIPRRAGRHRSAPATAAPCRGCADQ